MLKISEVLQELSEQVEHLEKENAEMRHDLETTNGLWAFDKQDFGPGDAFQIKHVSLMSKKERYEHFKAEGREMPLLEPTWDKSVKGWIMDPVLGTHLAMVKADGTLVF